MEQQLALFIVVSIGLILTPGIDTALVTRNSIQYGRVAGIMTIVGICSGIIIHTVAAAIGISAIIAKSAMLFEMIKYFGAAYLVYLGMKSLAFSKHKLVQSTMGDKEESNSCFRQGFLTNLLNPKIALFFMTFLPQFTSSVGSTFNQILLLGFVYTFLGFLWLMLYNYLLGYLDKWLKKPWVQQSIEKTTGLILLVLGLKLIFFQRES